MSIDDEDVLAHSFVEGELGDNRQPCESDLEEHHRQVQLDPVQDPSHSLPILTHSHSNLCSVRVLICYGACMQMAVVINTICMGGKGNNPSTFPFVVYGLHYM